MQKITFHSGRISCQNIKDDVAQVGQAPNSLPHDVFRLEIVYRKISDQL